MSPGAWAQDTLTHIAKTGELRMGHREASHPFSYKDPATGQVRGYSVDICTKIYEELKKELKRPDLRLTYVLVDGKNRLADLKNNVVDLECGTTTNTLERQKEVAFSHHIFIATTAFLVRKDSGIKTVDDLNGKRIAVERKTTNDGLLATNERTYHRKFIYVPVDSTATGIGCTHAQGGRCGFCRRCRPVEPHDPAGQGHGGLPVSGKAPFGRALQHWPAQARPSFQGAGRPSHPPPDPDRGDGGSLQKWFHSDQGTLPMSVFMREALKRPSDVGVEQIAF